MKQKNSKIKHAGLPALLACLLVLVAACGCSGNGRGTVGADPEKGDEPLLKQIKVNLTAEEYGIGVDKNQPELLEEVNKFVAQVKEDGTFDEICDHYFGNGKPVRVYSAERNPDKDQLLVASTLDFEPFEYGKIDEYYGIDMELAQALADFLGKELVIVNSNFETMFLSVDQHKCDVCIGGITITKEREKYVAFSDPYITMGQNLIVRADNTEFDEAETAEEVEAILRSKDGKTTVGVENLTISQYFCEGNKDYGYEGFPITVVRFKNASVALENLMEGNVDYVMIDAASGSFMVDEINGVKK